MEGSSRPERQVGRAPLAACVEEIFGEEIHAKRVASLIDGVDGGRQATSLGIRAIGRGLAVAQGLVPKPAITPVDRRLSNATVGLEPIVRGGVPFVVAERAESFVHVDWTAFEASAQGRVVLGRQTGPGRRPPLGWTRVTRSERQDQRNDHAEEGRALFATVVPEGGAGHGGSGPWLLRPPTVPVPERGTRRRRPHPLARRGLRGGRERRASQGGRVGGARRTQARAAPGQSHRAAP